MAKKKKNKRVGSIIFRIVLILIAGLTVGLGVFSWNASGLVGNQLPMPFGFGVSVILSDSMSPVLHTNDLVVVTEEDSYDVGDIVVYQEGKMLVVHRIIEINDETVTTKGDANNAADIPVPVEDIKAKLAFRVPFIGLIVKYIKTVPGTLLVLAIAVFLLYKSRQKERAKDIEELDDIVEEIKRLRESIAEQNSEAKAEGDSEETAPEAEQENAGEAQSSEEEAESTAEETADETSESSEEAGAEADEESNDEPQEDDSSVEEEDEDTAEDE